MMPKMNTRCRRPAVLTALSALLCLAGSVSAQTAEAPEKTAMAEKSAEELPRTVPQH